MQQPFHNGPLFIDAAETYVQGWQLLAKPGTFVPVCSDVSIDTHGQSQHQRAELGKMGEIEHTV